MKNKYHIQPGEKYGKLTCIAFSHIGKHYRSHFLFRCDCGKEKIILGSGVVSGNTKSCGCLSMEVKKSKILPDNKGVINHLILQYKRHAKRRNITFDLSYDEFKVIISKDCFYCGAPPSNNKITKNCPGFIYSGVDRVNSNNGYNTENCVPCCDYCNKAKSNKTLEDFKSWIFRVYAMADQWS